MVTVLEANYNPGKDELRIRATSSEQPLPTLTVVGYGEMTFNKSKYELKLKPVAPLPVPSTVTVVSSFSGSETALDGD